ncbi:MAG: peptidylprolyl isomerase [Verrucomicrobiota bacterium]|nr:peptidylprolyl isomerase [Limisphaera sp.]MDW8382772.1 peptidylprolyl isomerase [Verrucomicrobiota bacterium]
MPLSETLRAEWSLHPFYQKHTSVTGLLIMGSERVHNAALREAAYIVSRLLAERPDILETMRTQGVRIVVMAATEYTTDVPEHAHLKPRMYWDRRARGLGGRITSCGEENLLAFPGDPYAGESILIHEFAHAIDSVALRRLDPGFRDRLRTRFQQATTAGLWQGTYAAANPGEYWAEGVQSWFDANRSNDAHHNHVDTREELKAYDPGLAALCAEVFGPNPWRYRPLHRRTEADKAHLLDFDAAQAPRFQWREYPVGNHPRVRFETEFGSIEVELQAQEVPLATQQFLRAVLEGGYRGGALRPAEDVIHSGKSTDRLRVLELQSGSAMHESIRIREGTSVPSAPHANKAPRKVSLKPGTLLFAPAGSIEEAGRWFFWLGNEPARNGVSQLGLSRMISVGQVVEGLDVLEKIAAHMASRPVESAPVMIQGAFRVE